MPKNKQEQIKFSANQVKITESAKTDPNKVKQEIKQDVEAGQGDITSREAGSYRE